MKLHLSWSRIRSIFIVLGVLLILVLFLLPQTPLILIDFIAALVGLWFYIRYSYRSLVPRPQFTRYAIYRASIAAIIGMYCFGLVCWIIWSLLTKVPISLSRLSTTGLLVAYFILQEHEKWDLQQAIRPNDHRPVQ